MAEILIAVIADHDKVEEVAQKMKDQGFDMKKISIVGKDHYSKNGPVAQFPEAKKAKYFGGNFFDSRQYGSFSSPGGATFGVLGPMVSVLDEPLQENYKETEESFNFVNKALLKIGVPKDSSVKYQNYLSAEKYLLIIHGDAKDIETSKETIMKNNPIDIAVHKQ